MNTLRKIWLSTLCAVVMASVLPASAQVTWDAVKNKIKSAKDYTVTYKYNGPQGIYDFDYRWSPEAIRTEITDSKSDRSRRGTVIVYDKSWDAERVRAATGQGTIVRNLTHPDVVGRPFHQSLYQMILDQLDTLGQPTVSQSGDNTRFVFRAPGGNYTVWANANAEIIKTERKDGRSDEVRELRSHRWNVSPNFQFKDK